MASESRGSELDPGVLEAGLRHLGLDDPRVSAFVGDGRCFIQGVSAEYHVIAIDAYKGGRIPFHLATVEFWQEVRGALSDTGIAAVNIADGVEHLPMPHATRDSIARRIHAGRVDCLTTWPPATDDRGSEFVWDLSLLGK